MAERFDRSLQDDELKDRHLAAAIFNAAYPVGTRGLIRLLGREYPTELKAVAQVLPALLTKDIAVVWFAGVNGWVDINYFTPENPHAP